MMCAEFRHGSENAWASFEQTTVATGDIKDYAIFWIILTGRLPRQQQLVETGLPCREWVCFRSNRGRENGSRVI